MTIGQGGILSYLLLVVMLVNPLVDGGVVEGPVEEGVNEVVEHLRDRRATSKMW